MKEPEKIPLTDSPRNKEPQKIRLYPEPITNDLWQAYDTKHGPPVLAKNNENNLENNSQIIQELETNETN